MLKNTLTKRFVLFSLVAFFITGIILVLFVSNYMIDNKLKSTLELSKAVIDMNLKPMLKTETFITPFSNEQLIALKQKFSEIKKMSGIIEIRIWNTKGTLLYSEKSELVGKIFLDDKQLNTALNNKENYKVTKADKEENIMLGPESKEFIEIYDPIVFNGSVVGVLEIYRSFDPIRKQINELMIVIILILFFGLSVLYFLLIGIIYTTLNKIIEQNGSLIESKNALFLYNEKLNTLFKNTIISIIRAVDARDKYTAGHSKRVVEISLMIGKTLNMDDKSLEKLELAALFHDIGKLGIPESILNKPDSLTQLEYEKIKEHPSIGESIINQIEALEDILPIIRHHHEKFSGDGYPDGLSGENIPLESRIIALADAFDAMTTDRPYRKALSFEEALEEIKNNSSTQFDTSIVNSFFSIEEELKYYTLYSVVTDTHEYKVRSFY